MVKRATGAAGVVGTVARGTVTTVSGSRGGTAGTSARPRIVTCARRPRELSHTMPSTTRMAMTTLSGPAPSLRIKAGFARDCNHSTDGGRWTKPPDMRYRTRPNPERP